MIELLSHVGNDNTVANTARVSMQFGGEWDNIPDDYTEEKRDRLIAYLTKHKHTSPFRHNSITIRMSIPIFLARQLGKHQVGMSWNEVSRRYVATEPTFHTPVLWRSKPEGSIKQGSGTDYVGRLNFLGQLRNIDCVYDDYIEYTLDLYNTMLTSGVAPEQARMVLPQSMLTEVIWTGSLMAFAHVYKLRIDSHSQVEAQEFAKELDLIIRPLFPVSWEALVGD